MATTAPAVDGTTTNGQGLPSNPATKTDENVSVLIQALDSANVSDDDATRTKWQKSPYDEPLLPLIDRYIDEPRPLRVAVIGGGIAGIVAGILLPKKVPEIDLTIYDKNDDFVSPALNCDRHGIAANQ